MSTIKCEVTTISEIRPHQNADSLEIAIVGGWQACVKKGAHSVGEAVVYFEQGTVLSREIADKFCVTNYLSNKEDIDGNKVLVVHRIKLRGEPSFGLVLKPEDGMVVGQDVAEFYGAKKYVPPVKVHAGDSMSNHALFPAYTDIENMRSYPNIINVGEQVVATEKLHGSNARYGFVVEGGIAEYMAGSRSLRRKRPVDENMAGSIYWSTAVVPGVGALMRSLQDRGCVQAVIYGEVFGKGIQDYQYGLNQRSFRAFDLMIDGKYVDYPELKRLCDTFNVPMVPLVYSGEFSLDAIKTVSNGPSLVGGEHGREGVVVRPIKERDDPTIGRVILKYVGDEYLFGKAAQRDTTDQ